MAEEPTRLAEGLLGELPSDVVERVLSFLPIPALQRARTVCKAWNEMITSPEFGTLAIQHDALKQPGRMLVVREERGWSFFDVLESRWYVIKDGEFQPLLRIDGMRVVWCSSRELYPIPGWGSCQFASCQQAGGS